MGDLKDQRLEFLLNKSIRYYAKKRRFFEHLHRVAQTIILAGGSSAVTAIFNGVSGIALYSTAIITMIGLVDYIFDFSGREKNYGDLYKRTVLLSSELLKYEGGKDHAAQINSKRYQIYADAPPIGRVLDVICHNEEVIAQGISRNELYKINVFQSFFAHFFDIQSGSFQKISK